MVLRLQIVLFLIVRVIVINDKAFAIKRMVRKNDFRASGSGIIEYDKENLTDERSDSA